MWAHPAGGLGIGFKGKRKLKGQDAYVGLNFLDCWRKILVSCPRSPQPSLCYKCPQQPRTIMATGHRTRQSKGGPSVGEGYLPGRPGVRSWRVRKGLASALGGETPPGRRTKSRKDERAYMTLAMQAGWHGARQEVGQVTDCALEICEC